MCAAVIGFIDNVVFVGYFEIDQHQNKKRDGNYDVFHYFLKLFMVFIKPSSEDTGSSLIPNAFFIFLFETT